MAQCWLCGASVRVTSGRIARHALLGFKAACPAGGRLETWNPASITAVVPTAMADGYKPTAAQRTAMTTTVAPRLAARRTGKMPIAHVVRGGLPGLGKRS